MVFASLVTILALALVLVWIDSLEFARKRRARRQAEDDRDTGALP